MRLTYETGSATLIQFIIIAFLNIANALDSIISGCTHGSTTCVTNMLSSVLYYIAIVAWFFLIVVFGYMAQSKRRKRPAILLILSESAVFIFAAANIKLGITYHNGALGLFTSLVDLILSVWVITLAYRLMKAGGGRVVSRSRNRQHHNS